MLEDSQHFPMKDANLKGLNIYHKKLLELERDSTESYVGHVKDKEFEVEELEKAEFLIIDEKNKILKEKGFKDENDLTNHMFAQWSEDWDHIKEKRRKFRKKKDKTQKEVEKEYKFTKGRLEYLTKMSNEIQTLESSNTNSQQVNNEENLKIEILTNIKKIKDLEIDLDTFELIKSKEDESGLIRMHEVDSYINELKNKEKRLQQVFQKLNEEIEIFKNEKNQSQICDNNSDQSKNDE